MLKRRYILSFVVILFFAIGVAVVRMRSAAPYPLGGVVDVKNVVRFEVVYHGLDVVRIFELSDDGSMASRLIANWNMIECSEHDDVPLSFVSSDSPDWWMKGVNGSWKKYSAKDMEHEKYWSMWQDTESNRAFIEVGQW